LNCHDACEDRFQGISVRLTVSKEINVAGFAVVSVQPERDEHSALEYEAIGLVGC